MDFLVKEKFIEKSTSPIYVNGVKLILNQMTKCICKIYAKDGSKSTGFFCKIPYPDKSHLLPILVTTYHSLDYLKNDDSFQISINDEYEFRNIKINNMRKIYMDKKIDTIFIEILPEDKINDFLEIDDIIFKEEELKYIYKNNSVYVLQYIKDELAVSSGLLKGIHESELIHYCNTYHGSAGMKLFKILKILKKSNFLILIFHLVKIYLRNQNYLFYFIKILKSLKYMNHKFQIHYLIILIQLIK